MEENKYNEIEDVFASNENTQSVEPVQNVVQPMYTEEVPVYQPVEPVQEAVQEQVQSVEPTYTEETPVYQQPIVDQTGSNTYNISQTELNEHPDGKIVLNKNTEIEEEPTEKVKLSLNDLNLKENKTLMFVLGIGLILFIGIILLPFIS